MQLDNDFKVFEERRFNRICCKSSARHVKFSDNVSSLQYYYLSHNLLARKRRHFKRMDDYLIICVGCDFDAYRGLRNVQIKDADMSEQNVFSDHV